MKPCLFAAVALALLVVGAPAQDRDRWAEAFAAKPGYFVRTDLEAFRFATAVAAVPNPGPGPKAPLYFVTELRGSVKVVTRDRSVHVFAKDFFTLPAMPAQEGQPYVPEFGMAGIALAPAQGYVFVSFTYGRPDGSIRNGILRFTSKPQTFGLKAEAQLPILELFEDQIGDLSHQIGPMLVEGDSLLVCVGDAHNPAMVQELDSTAGKILRMGLDGRPLADNPFYTDGDPLDPRSYIWARGFRNPFGICRARGELFVTDVGPSVDRFLRVERGENYGYDGSDWSMAAHCDVSFSPSVSPVSLIYIEPDSSLMPAAKRDAFYLVTSGLQVQTGPSKHGDKAVLQIRYDFEKKRVIGRPQIVVQYRENQQLMPVGLSKGKDAIYLACFSPHRNGSFPVLRFGFEPEYTHRYGIADVQQIIERYGCMGCHTESGEGAGPPLRPHELVPRLMAKLSSAEYRAQSLALDQHEDPVIKNAAPQRQAVREAEGLAQVRLWMEHRLLEPRFDDPKAIMPKLGLSRAEARKLAESFTELGDTSAVGGIRQFIRGLFPEILVRHLLLFLGLGLLLGFVAGILALALWGRWRRRRQARLA